MSKKAYGYWRGRPNPPPLNWNTPGSPVIRKVAGWSNDLRFFGPSHNDIPLDDSGLVAVSLTNGHWICILQALHHYGQAHGDAEWMKWWKRVRRSILGVVNPNRDEKKPVAVKLSLEDWRMIWRQVRAACQGLGEHWIDWFGWLSQTMMAQIKGD